MNRFKHSINKIKIIHKINDLNDTFKHLFKHIETFKS